MPEAATKASARDSKRDAARAAMEDAMLDILAENEEGGLTHDRIAARLGIGRRTVYRYFPDRQALMEALWLRLTQAAGPGPGMPHDLASLTGQLPQLFSGFDKAASAMTVCMSSGQGRAMRAAKTPERRASYRAALAPATAGGAGAAPGGGQRRGRAAPRPGRPWPRRPRRCPRPTRSRPWRRSSSSAAAMPGSRCATSGTSTGSPAPRR